MAETRTGTGTRRALLIAARCVLAVAILYFVWTSLSGSLARSGFAQLRFDAGWLAAAWAALLVYYLLFIGGLALVFRALGYAPRYRDVLKLSFGANLGKYLPGGFWQVAGKLAMARRAGVDRHAALVASVIESGVSVAGGTLMFLSTTALGVRLPAAVPAWAPYVLAVAIVGALHPAVFARVVAAGMRLLRIEGEPPHLSFRATLGLVAYYAGIWWVAGVAFALFARSLTPLARPGDLVALAGGYAAAMIVGLLVLFVPAGLGVREGVLLVVLQAAFGPGGGGAAAVVSVAARVWSTLLELALSALAVALPYAGPGLDDDADPGSPAAEASDAAEADGAGDPGRAAP